MTDIFNLNDPSELSHGFSHAANILNSKAEKGQPESQIFAKRFAAFHQGGLHESAHFFVCSFSADGDDLGQWRAYADNGRGYALGFDASALESAFTRQNKLSSTYLVQYDDAVLADIHRQIIESMFELISLPRGRNLGNASIEDYMTHLSALLSVHALHTALFFKHKAYSHEREYRFLEMYPAGEVPPEVRQRYRSYELVKYREFDWKYVQPGALKQIIVGPAADCTKATQFAKDCLTAFDLGNIEITRSNIPYRAL